MRPRDVDERRFAWRGARHLAFAQDAFDDQTKFVLGVFLQRDFDSRRRAWIPKSNARRRRDGIQQRLCGEQ